jgi:ubiquitin C-terminal hydrolase
MVLNYNNTKSIKDQNVRELFETYQQVIKDQGDPINNDAISTYQFLLKSESNHIIPSLNEQQDAFEFLIKFIDKIADITEDFKTIFKISTHCYIKSYSDPMKVISSDDGDDKTSLVLSLGFDYKVFNNMALSIANFLNKTLDEYTYTEETTKNEITEKATIKEVIESLPQILIFQISRIKSNGIFQTKVFNAYQISKTFDMYPFLSENLQKSFTDKRAEYELIGIILHIGPDPKDGHYVSWCKDNKANNRWIEYNDSLMSEIPEYELNAAINPIKNFNANDKVPYILFYRKKK